MQIRRYDHERDYPMISEWHRGWKQEPVDPELLSDYGIIVGNIAAAWLYTSNSKLTWIECTVVDPKSDKTARRDAIVALYKELFNEAKRLGFSLVMGYTISPRIASDSDRYGTKFIKDPMYLLVKNLKE